jgi:hypothetical protein
VLNPEGTPWFSAYDAESDWWPTLVEVEGTFAYIDSGNDYVVGVTHWGDVYSLKPSEGLTNWVQIPGKLK